MAKKLAWLSAHPPTSAQREDLEGRGYAIHQMDGNIRFTSAKHAWDIAIKCCNGVPDAVMAIIPMAMLAEFLNAANAAGEIPVIRADMEAVARASDGTREYRWLGTWTRTVRVIVETETWGPNDTDDVNDYFSQDKSFRDIENCTDQSVCVFLPDGTTRKMSPGKTFHPEMNRVAGVYLLVAPEVYHAHPDRDDLVMMGPEVEHEVLSFGKATLRRLPTLIWRDERAETWHEKRTREANEAKITAWQIERAKKGDKGERETFWDYLAYGNLPLNDE